MRVTAIVLGMVLMSLVGYAQQERQMQKPGEAQVSLAKTNSPVVSTPSAPHQMMRAGDKPASTTTPVTRQSNDEKREMVPLNPNQAVKKRN